MGSTGEPLDLGKTLLSPEMEPQEVEVPGLCLHSQSSEFTVLWYCEEHIPGSREPGRRLLWILGCGDRFCMSLEGESHGICPLPGWLSRDGVEGASRK